jgi:hypothetical protein
VRSLGHNLENGRSCGFTRASDVRADPRLGPLENNGGPTLTHRLMRGSPAIDAGGFPFPPTDQRGLVRPQGPASDIGAYERRASGPIPGGIPPSNPEECTHRGTSGNDILRGTPGNDVICGGAGNDVIYGLGGNDELRGGEGNDVLRGGGGNDKLNGSRGNDDLVGGDGEDRLTGGPGKDNLTGQGGRDSLDSRDDVRGNDVANGGPANDWCSTDPRDVRTSC